MQTLTGDIWQLAVPTDAIVIPTNVGWRQNGTNVMGRGLAAQAARRWHELPKVYGEYCQENGAASPIMIFRPPNKRWCKMLLLFPVKPLNREQPYLSWRQDASPALIEYHLGRLTQFADHHCEETTHERYFAGANGARILVPSLGCGNGALDETLVLPLLNRYLVSSCFYHVKYEGSDAGVLSPPVS